jgi:hypothetical protein
VGPKWRCLGHEGSEHGLNLITRARGFKFEPLFFSILLPSDAFYHVMTQQEGPHKIQARGVQFPTIQERDCRGKPNQCTM